MQITIPPEAKYYEIQIRELKEENELLKARNKVLEDNVISISKSLGKEIIEKSKLVNKIEAIKVLINLKEDGTFEKTN
jgi:hypothetical protein